MSPEYSPPAKRDRFTRPNELIGFVRDEIDQYREGVLDRLSSNDELRVRFGYKDKTSIVRHLSKTSLLDTRREAWVERETLQITPSIDWAWMLGVLATGAHVRSTGRISVFVENDDFMTAFIAAGERLFGVNPRTKPIRSSRTGREKRYVEFNSKRATNSLGDLGRYRWPQTIKERYPWILEDPKFSWAFLEGAFDRVGDVHPGTPYGTRLRFNVSDLDGANLALYMLTSLGVKEPKLPAQREISTGIRGVGIYNVEDIKLIAANIHSKIPEVEAKLEFFRQRPLPVPVSSPDSNEEAIQEWINLRRTLDHVPTAPEIHRLRQLGQTRFYPHIYISRFGQIHERRTFSAARSHLEKIVFEREINQALSEYEGERGIQVRYTPKQTRAIDGAKRLDGIISKLSLKGEE